MTTGEDKTPAGPAEADPGHPAQEYMEDNRSLWDARTRVHVQVYPDIGQVREGGISLGPPDLDEVGPVRGKSLLHLQCHFGLDTLSWARLGAEVVGVDFSGESIAAARALASECGLAAEFLEANVYDLPRVLHREFDIVYTSHGVLWWLPDLRAWAQVIAGALRPGGLFYICEIHPLAGAMEYAGGRIYLARDYFPKDVPMSFRTSGSYVDAPVEVEERTEHGWAHTVSDVINALVEAGLVIERMNECPYAAFRMLPEFERGRDGHYWPPKDAAEVPLLFSIRARKPDR